MNDYKKARMADLKVLISKAIKESVLEETIHKVFEYEKQLAENREILSLLNDQNILSDQEFNLKIRICFNLFLSKITNELGEEACRSIYDYAPGEQVDFMVTKEASVVDGSNKDVFVNVQSIKSILDFACSIASQTNLLAIEAARIEGYEQEFVVIADQVRKVAQITQETIKEIMPPLEGMTDHSSMRLNKLMVDPSSTNWQEELFSLLEGENDHQLEKSGDTPKYTEKLIALSKDKARSRTSLLSALENIFRSWTLSTTNPNSKKQVKQLVILFDLAICYAPSYGFLRIIELFNSSCLFDLIVSENLEVDLPLKALHALERYFPVSPTEETYKGAYERYISVLWGLIRDKKYASYAARILIQHQELVVKDKSIPKLVIQEPKIIHGIVEFLLDPTNEVQAESDLSSLFEICTRIGEDMKEQFINILSELNAEIDPYNLDEPNIIITDPISSDMRSLLLNLSPNFIPEYVRYCDGQANRAPSEFIHSLLIDMKVKNETAH